MISTFCSWDLAGKKVLLRIDANVPLASGNISDDFRLQQLLPTLTALRGQGAQVTMITHLDRPQGVDRSLSTSVLRSWFDQRGFSAFELAENLRFDPREREGDKAYASELAVGFDYFITDAWGAFHRRDASIAQLPLCFTPEKRSIGLLVERELAQLAPFYRGENRPFISMIGGGKSETKIRLLLGMVRRNRVDGLIVLPGVSKAFCVAADQCTNMANVKPELVLQAKELVEVARQRQLMLVFPETNTPSISSEMIEQIRLLLLRTRGVFFNGVTQDEPSNQAIFELLQGVSVPVVLGGGDTVASFRRIRNLDGHIFCSTGGGSTLAFLAGEELPGLTPFVGLHAD